LRTFISLALIRHWCASAKKCPV